MKSFSGIILAAGKGNRLNNYNKPKSTLELKKNYTLLDKIISNFKKNKIKKLFIITGYKENYLKKYNIKKIFNKNWKNTNMLKSLLCADKILKKNDCIVSYSDIFYDESAIRLLKKQKSDIPICYLSNWLNLWKRRFNDPLVDAETFKLEKKTNILKAIGSKPKNLRQIEGQYMGLLYFTPSGWKKIKNILKKIKNKNKINKLSMTQLLNIILNQGIKIKAVKYKNYFAEIDFPKDYNILKSDLKRLNLTKSFK